MNNENKTTSIINVTVNGVSALDALKTANNRLASIEKSVFNVAILVAYATGTEIPAHVDYKGNAHGVATCEKPIKQKDACKIVTKSEATISRWLKAFKLILEDGHFNDFALQVYPFSFDKIILIYENNLQNVTELSFNDLMSMSVNSLKSLVTKETKVEEEVQEEEVEEEVQEEEVEEEEITEEEEEITIIKIDIDGVNYSINKKALIAFLELNGTILK